MADCGVSKGSAKAEQIEWDGGVENGRGVHGSTEAYDSIATSCSRVCLRCAVLGGSDHVFARTCILICWNKSAHAAPTLGSRILSDLPSMG
jgi:hypothetical protein